MPATDPLERTTDLLLALLDAADRPRSQSELLANIPGYPEPGTEAARQMFERDKKLLKAQGVPVETVDIEGPDQKGYRVDPAKYYLPDLGLEPDEQAALNLAVAAVHLGEPTGHHALAKLGVGAGRPSPGDAAGAAAIDLGGLAGLPALPAIWDAVRTKAPATFGYRGERRTVSFGGIRFHGGYWYAVGWDAGRSDVRTFRVDRIETTVTLGDAGTATLPVGFDASLSSANEPWRFGDGDQIEVEVAVDRAEAPRVVTELGDAAVVRRDDDGGVVVRMGVTDTEALVDWVLDLLHRAEVLSPPEVRQAVIDRLEALVAAGTGR